MPTIPEEDYRTAILKRFEEVKKTDALSIGNYMSPAQLRNFCLMQFDNELTKKDESIFRAFFEASPGTNLRRAIEQFSTGKLKSVISLLEGRDFHSHTRLELAAVLVNFEPRPFSHFLKNRISSVEHEPIGVQINAEYQPSDKENTIFKGLAIKQKRNIVQWNWKGILLASAVIGIAIISIFYITKKDCMQWQNDHFELMDCSTAITTTGFDTDIIAIDAQKDLRQFQLTSKMPTKKKNQPFIWYHKHQDTVTFFNQSGVHPITGNPLKPCTDYMRLKYHIKCSGNKYVSE